MNVEAFGELRIEARPRSLSEVVFERIHQAIVDKVLPPGASVTEQDLATRLNVSKTPVREAFLRLREIGLIEPDGLRGLRVVQLSPDGVRHAYELRLALETFTARSAAALAGDTDRARILDEAAASLDGAQRGDIPAFRAHDRAMHRAIAEVAANPRISQLISDAGDLISTLLRRDYPHGDGPVECGLAHVRIAEAIAAGKRGVAATEMGAHIQYVQKLTLASLESTVG